MTKTKNSNSKNFFVKAAFTLWFAFFTTVSFASDFYWVGGTGNWSDYGTHWATSSGGVIFHTTVPSANDNIFFDSNSFSSPGDTVFVDVNPAYCNNMDWSGVTNNPVFTGPSSLKIYGSLTLTTGLTFSVGLGFNAFTMGNTITSTGHYLSSVTFDNDGGWILNDSLTAGDVRVNSGTFNTNNYNVSCWQFYAGDGSGLKSTVLLGTSVITCQKGWKGRDTTDLALDATASSIIITDSVNIALPSYVFDGGTHQQYGDVSCNVIQSVNNSFHNIYIPYVGYIQGANNNFNDVFFPKQGFIQSQYDTINNIYFSDGGSIGMNATVSKAVFSDNASINGGTFDTLIFNNPGKIITISGTNTVNSEMTIASGTCNDFTIIESQSGLQGTIIKANGIVTVDYAQIQDINATGGATFIANNSINGGNVTGWTINSIAPKDLYWIGGSGNWSDNTHWSLTSGGAGIGGNCLPTQFDNIFFDSNSFSSPGDTVFVDVNPAYCNNMDWSGVTNNPVFTGPSSLKIYGSLTLTTGLTFSVGLGFNAFTMGNTITSTGHYLSSVTFDNDGGWILNDSLTAGDVRVNSGTFNTNNYNVSCWQFYAGDGSGLKSTVLLGTSVITCQKGWKGRDTTDLALDATASSIIITDSVNIALPSYVFDGGTHQQYGDVSCNVIQSVNNSFHNIYIPYVGYIQGANNNFNDVFFPKQGFIQSQYDTINNIYFSDGGSIGMNATVSKAVFSDNASINGGTFDTLIFNNPGKIITISGTNTVNSEMTIASGTCNDFTIIESQSGLQGTIIKANGIVTVDYAQIQDINATGGATFIANNSINGGNVTGWTINSIAPKDLYWIGGSGNWSDNTHWSLTSGGAGIGGNCLPTQFDNIFFDSNSFSSPGDTVFVDVNPAYCNNMDWSGVTNNPVFTGPSSLKIYGSLTLTTGLTFSVGLGFNAFTMGNTITSTGHYLSSVTFDNDGGWILNDSLTAGDVRVNSGTFNTNNYNVSCWQFYAGDGSGLKSTVLLGTSVITCQKGWKGRDTTDLALDATASSIIITDSVNIALPSYVFDGGTHQQYGDVSCNVIQSVNNSFHNIYIPYVGYIQGANNNFNDVFFPKQGFIQSQYDTINNIYFSDGGSIGSNATVNKAMFAGDASISGGTFDTLIFNNSGKTITISGTNTVNNKMIIESGQSAFPTLIHSASLGIQATISESSDTVCSNYLIVQDINVTGGAVFYAGSNSVNISNNSGWIWSSCIPDTSNVWPGDANYDLTANNVDVLYVGLAYGYTGTTRTGASNAWVAQPSVDWLQQFANGTNLKNADCNGDGTIDNNDTTAISLNYGLTHPFKAAPPLPSPNSTGIPFYLVSNLDSAGLNFTVNLDMSLGNSMLQINNLYGLAFTLNFDTGYIDTNNVAFDFSNSMMGTPGVDLMTFTKSFASQGYIDVAMTRTDQNNVSGYGHLAKCGIVIVDNVAGISTVPFTISNITAFDKNEFPVTLTAYGDSLVVDTNLIASTHQIDLTQFVSVYPNPAKDILKINGGVLNIQSVELISIMGEKIYDKKVDAHTTSISTQNIKDGLYVLRCITDKGIVNRRVQVLK